MCLLSGLCGVVGVVVNSVAFELAESAGFPLWTTELNKAIDPIYTSFLFSVQLSIFVLFVLNNEFTFWEDRYRGWKLVPAFLAYEVVSNLGTLIHVAVFTFLQNPGFLLGVLAPGPARVVKDRNRAVLVPNVN